MIRIVGFPVQTQFGTWPGFGTQPCFEAPADLHVKRDKNIVIDIGLVRLYP